MKTCSWCGEKFFLSKYNPNANTCSKQCSYRLSRQKRIRDRKPQSCVWCGCFFTPKHGYRIFCSAICKEEEASFYQSLTHGKAIQGSITHRAAISLGVARAKLLSRGASPKLAQAHATLARNELVVRILETEKEERQ